MTFKVHYTFLNIKRLTLYFIQQQFVQKIKQHQLISQKKTLQEHKINS